MTFKQHDQTGLADASDAGAVEAGIGHTLCQTQLLLGGKLSRAPEASVEGEGEDEKAGTIEKLTHVVIQPSGVGPGELDWGARPFRPQRAGVQQKAGAGILDMGFSWVGDVGMWLRKASSVVNGTGDLQKGPPKEGRRDRDYLVIDLRPTCNICFLFS